MARHRPSDIFGAPATEERPSAHQAAQASRHQGRGGPALATAAAVFIIVALASTLLSGAANDPVEERHAILALRLFERQAAATDQLSQRVDVYAPPGPGDAARAAEQAAAEVRALIIEARGELRQSPGVDYGADPSHDDFVRSLEELAFAARATALLAAVHDAIFAGAGTVPRGEAQQYVTNVAALVPSTSPLGRWAQALLGAMEGQDRFGDAEHARGDSREAWAATVRLLRPPAVEQLRTVVAHVPQPVLESLRGDGTIGHALQRLETPPAETPPAETPPAETPPEPAIP